MGKVMNLIKEIKETLRMEIRPNSQGLEYLEAVINKKDLELLNSLLKKHLGSAAKESGKEANLPKEIQKTVDSLGGLRNEQSFFYRQDGNKVVYAAIWPWQSNPNKITLKSGVSELVLTD
jgi:Fe-S cluster assembly scaffold protein SufB